MSEYDERKMSELIRRAAISATKEAINAHESITEQEGLDEAVHALNIYASEELIDQHGPGSQVEWAPELLAAMTGESVAPPSRRKRSIPRWIDQLLAPRLSLTGGLAVCVVIILITLWLESGIKNDLTASISSLKGQLRERSDRQVAMLNQLAEKDAEIAALNHSRASTGNGSRMVVFSNGKSIPLADVNETNLLKEGAIRIGTSNKLKGNWVSAGNPEFTVMAPNHTLVATETPTLHWNKADNQREILYRVTLSEDRESQKVSPEPPTRLTSWSVPKGRLKPGGVYAWSVEAQLQNRVMKSDMGRFQVLDSSKLQEAQSVLSDTRLSDLQRAVYAASVGLLDDAENDLKKSTITNPIVRQELKKSLEAARGKN